MYFLDYPCLVLSHKMTKLFVYGKTNLFLERLIEFTYKTSVSGIL